MPSKKRPAKKKPAKRTSAATAKKKVALAAKRASPKKSAVKKKSVAKKSAVKKSVAKKSAAMKKGAPSKAAPKKRATATAKTKTAAKKTAAKRPPAKVRAGTAPRPLKKISPPRAATKASSVKRRDGAGHLDPQYAAGLREKSSVHDADAAAFVNGNRADDDLAEELAEEVVEKATTGEDEGEDVANQEVTEDRGGPFVVTTGGTEFADGVDESNPADAQREPFPKV